MKSVDHEAVDAVQSSNLQFGGLVVQNDHFFADVQQFAVINFGLCELKHIGCESDDGKAF